MTSRLEPPQESTCEEQQANSTNLNLVEVTGGTQKKSTQAAAPAPKEQASAAGAPKYIGDAFMRRDGSVVLHLNAQQNHAQADLVYKKGDPNLGAILKHLHGLKVGQHKPVLPWPEPGS